MSYILEALKKADQERNRGDVPTISSAHMAMVSERGIRTPLIWIMGGLLLVNLVFLYLYLGSRPAAQSVERVSTVAETAPPAIPPAVDVSRNGLSSAPHPAHLSGEMTEAEELGMMAPKEDPPVRIVLPPPSPEPAPPRQVTAAVSKMPLQRPQPSEKPQLPQATQPLEEGVPVWQNASGEAKMFAAGLSLDVHVYAELPRQRFVLINMVKYREGDELREGARLERITESGVVLQYRGEDFRIDRQ